MSLGEAPFKLVAISAGTSEPSTTRMLADRAVQATVKQLRGRAGTRVPTSGHSLHSYVPLRPRQHFLPNPPIGDHLNLASALTEQQENLPRS